MRFCLWRCVGSAIYSSRCAGEQAGVIRPAFRFRQRRNARARCEHAISAEDRPCYQGTAAARRSDPGQDALIRLTVISADEAPAGRRGNSEGRTRTADQV
jgi:hypothetical protein